MKINFINTAKLILTDRLVTVLIVLLGLLCIAYCMYVGIALRPSDLQVAVHYSAFGNTSFYREKWYYLITFIAFGALIAVIHTVLIVKLYAQERRQIALLFAWLSVLLVVITWVITWAILKVAFL